MDDLISRQAAIDAVCMEWCDVKHQDCKHPFDAEKDDYYWCDGCETALRTLPELPSAEPEIKPIEYRDCANAMLKMWMDNIVTDGEYNRIMDKLNAHWRKKDG